MRLKKPTPGVVGGYRLPGVYSTPARTAEA